jgi:hypothetical protein
MLAVLLVCAATAHFFDTGVVEPMPAGRYMPTHVAMSPALHGCSARARLVFHALWPHLDSAGRISGNLGMVRSLVAPSDRELTERKIGGGLEELVRARLVRSYVADGERVIFFVDFLDSQPASLYIERERASRFGPPPGPDENSRAASAAVVPFSPHTPQNPPGSLSKSEDLELQGFASLDSGIAERAKPLPTVASAVRSLRMLRGNELMNGLGAFLNATSTIGFAAPRREDEDAVFTLGWFAYYMAKLGFPDDMLDDKREALIRRRYVECRRDADLMLFVVDGVRRDPFRMGQDPKKGDDPRLRAVRSILKDFEIMQEFARKGGWVSGKPHPMRARIFASLEVQTNQPGGAP